MVFNYFLSASVCFLHSFDHFLFSYTTLTLFQERLMTDPLSLNQQKLFHIPKHCLKSILCCSEICSDGMMSRSKCNLLCPFSLDVKMSHGNETDQFKFQSGENASVKLTKRDKRPHATFMGTLLTNEMPKWEMPETDWPIKSSVGKIYPLIVG